ncbi:26192_t:CDS:2, partial [Gigaspora margarita]
YNGTIYNPNHLPIHTHNNYLQDIKEIECNTSFPVDTMHALFENVAQHMFHHLTGKFYNNEKLNDTEYKILTHNWNKIGKIIEHNQKTMLLEFGRPPINIQKYYNGFKAEDWHNWTVLYSLPLFQNHLPAKYINGWAKFVRVMQLCLEPTITNEVLKEIKVLFIDFINHYEQENYQKDPNRLSATLISFHYLLHISDSIFETGPAWATWQFLMERLCEMLIPLVHSRQNPYTNLTNQVTTWTRFTHLQFHIKYSQEIFGLPSEKSQIHSFDHFFNPPNEEEQLYSLFKEHLMTKPEIPPVELEEREFYQIYVNNIRYFRNFGEIGVINITTIDRCVGFPEVATNKHVIIDRENRDTFR